MIIVVFKEAPLRILVISVSRGNLFIYLHLRMPETSYLFIYFSSVLKFRLSVSDNAYGTPNHIGPESRIRATQIYQNNYRKKI